MTAQKIANKLNLALSTGAGLLQQAALGKLSRLDPKPLVRRYQRSTPSERLHLDITKLRRNESIYDPAIVE